MEGKKRGVELERMTSGRILRTWERSGETAEVLLRFRRKNKKVAKTWMKVCKISYIMTSFIPKDSSLELAMGLYFQRFFKLTKRWKPGRREYIFWKRKAFFKIPEEISHNRTLNDQMKATVNAREIYSHSYLVVEVITLHLTRKN